MAKDKPYTYDDLAKKTNLFEYYRKLQKENADRISGAKTVLASHEREGEELAAKVSEIKAEIKGIMKDLEE